MIALLSLALALAADAFAASLCQGVAARSHSVGVALRCGLAFGAAQGAMPLLGWSLGRAFGETFAAVDHWIAFVTLGVLGAKLLQEALTKGPEDETPASPAVGWALLMLAMATSLDAAAAGLAFDAMALSVWVASGVIAAVTALVCAVGVLIGARLGPSLGARAELIGGCALIALGVKILFDHNAFGAAL